MSSREITFELAAAGFSAAGSEARLQVLRCLVRAGPEGLNIGEIQERVGIPPSTLAHHLRFLSAGGLILQQKVGRSVVNRADFDQITALAEFLLNECCADCSEESCEVQQVPAG